MEPKFIVVMGPLADDELYCHVMASFPTREEAESYSKGVFQILELPQVTRWET